MPNSLITPELALDLWYQALPKEFGIVIPILDVQDGPTIMQKLYDARSDIRDERLQALGLHLSQDGMTLYISRKEVELEP